MDNKLLIFQEIVPESIVLLNQRTLILAKIKESQPIGRRALAASLDLGERVVRNETDFLREAGFIDTTSAGMIINSNGEYMIKMINQMNYNLRSFHQLETKISKYLNIKNVLIVPGNASNPHEHQVVIKSIGHMAANCIKEFLPDTHVLAVTGGVTVHSAAEAFDTNDIHKNILVIPARGGMGRDVEYQSNSIAALFAKKLGGNYRLLHVPDLANFETNQALREEPSVKSIVQLMKSADTMIYGIGMAKDMIIKRNLPSDLANYLMSNGALSEVFGYYFSKDGSVIYDSNAIGLKINDLAKIKHKICVAAGEHKAGAIVSALKNCKAEVLVTDEGAARAILKSI